MGAGGAAGAWRSSPSRSIPVAILRPRAAARLTARRPRRSEPDRRLSRDGGARIALRPRHEGVRVDRRRRRRRPHARRRRAARPRGPERLRQVDAAAGRRRAARPPTRATIRSAATRRRRRRRSTRAPPHRARLPGARPVPAPRPSPRTSAFGLRDAGSPRAGASARRVARPGRARRPRRPLPPRALRRRAPAGRAGPCAGAPTRACCCSTSRSPASTPTCAPRSASTSSICCARRVRRRCSSPTTSSRRSAVGDRVAVMRARADRAGRHADRRVPRRRATGSSPASWATPTSCRSPRGDSRRPSSARSRRSRSAPAVLRSPWPGPTTSPSTSPPTGRPRSSAASSSARRGATSCAWPPGTRAARRSRTCVDVAVGTTGAPVARHRPPPGRRPDDEL